jgi:alkylhydroperoxidase/carboxymuconolactone decarboxylase family protein YurZ
VESKNTVSPAGPLDSVTDIMSKWDESWSENISKVAQNPWKSGVLPLKLVELISVGINVACTNLNADGTRRHIRAAIQAGASRDEILFVIKCATVMSIHSLSLAAPILLDEADVAGVHPKPKEGAVTPACDKMKAIGQWNKAWDPFMELDPVWTNDFMATGMNIYGSGILSPKDTELLSIAFDASFTHMYAPGVRRHIKGALKAGASIEEIVDTLKICVAQGVQSCNLGVAILEEEL